MLITWAYRMPFDGRIFVVLPVGVVFGLLFQSSFSVLIHTLGGPLHGTATFDAVAAALAWSRLPVLVVGALWLTAFVASEAKNDDQLRLVADLLSHRVMWPANLWAAALLVVMIAEVNRFSRWRALASILGSAAIVAGILGAVGYLFALLFAG